MDISSFIRHSIRLSVACSFMLAGPSVRGELVVLFADPSGLAAEATFKLISGTELEVRLRNTSTGVPSGFSNSDQILTSISWDFVTDTSIKGGTAITGPNSQTVNFQPNGSFPQDFGPGTDVSGEWGYGNKGTTGLLPNMVSTLRSHTKSFGGANLDGPDNLDGPESGLITNPALIPLGGLGAIRDEIVVALLLKGDPLEDLQFLTANGAIVEFGSDAAFVNGSVVAEPSSTWLACAVWLTLGGVVWYRAQFRNATQ